MKFNQTILQLLSSLEKNSIQLGNLVHINYKTIALAGFNIQEKIKPNKIPEKENIKNIEKFDGFIDSIKPSIKRLNHLGISYGCTNISEELKTYIKLAKENHIQLTEEKSDSPKSRWFFIKNSNNWKSPLFEIVLTESPSTIENDWIPHFQIDIDTSLTPQEVSDICKKHFGKDFVGWELTVPNKGVVLAMGKLGDVSGVNIYLGIGTNLRNTKNHREKILKSII